MRRWIGAVLGLLCVPTVAAAECGGTDRLAALAASNPAAHAAIMQRAALVPNGSGLFWRVERAGSPASYLFGTFHDPELAAEPLDDAVVGALNGARLVLVEVTLAEQQRMRKRMATDPGFVFGGPGSGLSDRLDPAERDEADKALRARGLTLALADRARPAILMSVLAQPLCVIEAMQRGAPILDVVLMERAKVAGKRVKGMESYLQALESLDSLPPDVMGPLLVEALRSLDELEDFRRTAVGLYRAGEVAALLEFEMWRAEQDFGAAGSRHLFEALSDSAITGRNRLWMRVMVPEMQRGGVFAAFGAMHLIGEDGVVELLRREGFTVTRLDG